MYICPRSYFQKFKSAPPSTFSANQFAIVNTYNQILLRSMRFTMPAASTVYILVVLSVLVHVTLADFDLYHCSGHQLLETGPPPSILVPRYIDEWKVADGDKLPTSRDKIDFNAGWGPSKDVSHGRHGVRCEGSCDYKDVSLGPAFLPNDEMLMLVLGTI